MNKIRKNKDDNKPLNTKEQVKVSKERLTLRQKDDQGTLPRMITQH